VEIDSSASLHAGVAEFVNEMRDALGHRPTRLAKFELGLSAAGLNPWGGFRSLTSNKGPSVLTRRLEGSMDLYLVRHAVAFRRDPDRWPLKHRRQAASLWQRGAAVREAG
jgi:hypothetical protein